ncbi:unnamed protein product [Withania somnifera]
MEFGGNRPAAEEKFDASQYAFFGNDVVEEVELGGLEDEEDSLPPVEFDDEVYQLGQEEGEALGSLSEIDDFSSTYLKFNKDDVSNIKSGFSGDKEYRGSSSAVEWSQSAAFHNWIDRKALDGVESNDNKRWPSQPHSSAAHLFESKTLYRASSYPEQQQQHEYQQKTPNHHYSSEPVLIPELPLTSFPPSARHPQGSPNNQLRNPNGPNHPGGQQMPVSLPNLSPFLNAGNHLTASHLGPQYSGKFAQGTPPGLPLHNQIPNQWLKQSTLYTGERSSLTSNMMPRQSHHQNGFGPLHGGWQQPRQSGQQHPLHSPYGHLPGLPSQPFNHHMSPSAQMMNNFDMLGLGDLRDQKAKPMPRGREGLRYSQLGFEVSSQRNVSAWPKFRSKYMTTDELENILRAQLAATHSNDPYVDDYYHQACLEKKSAGAKLKHHFCPNNLMDGSARTLANTDPHPFLQIDALGRVAFSSIHRPRPLLEVDPPKSSVTGCIEQKMSVKPLEQEPMLAARVTIENGFCLLLDVDDIDRFLQFNQLPDGGDQLKRRRQVLLEDLASSLQVVDPLGKSGHSVNLAAKDDVVFLRIVSLPKGRKLLVRYLQLLFPGSELTRVVCMAIFRHLRFLFGRIPSDHWASETTVNLGRTVSLCIYEMELKALSACLASVVCSPAHPPLRPLGSPAGDGASVVLKSILERATELLRDPHAAGMCSMPNRAFWQASFDAFFGLLTKYCFSKYDTVMQCFLTQAPPDVAVNGSDAAKAISRKMPVELLRASLPHTSEQQKKVLLEFAHRSMPVLGVGSQSWGSGGT